MLGILQLPAIGGVLSMTLYVMFHSGGQPRPITLWLVVASGNTYPQKKFFAALGGRWSAKRRAWFIDTVPTRTAQKILCNVRSGVWPGIDLTIKPQKVIARKECI